MWGILVPSLGTRVTSAAVFFASGDVTSSFVSKNKLLPALFPNMIVSSKKETEVKSFGCVYGPAVVVDW